MKLRIEVSSTLYGWALAISEGENGFYQLTYLNYDEPSTETYFSLRDLEHLRDELTTLINAEKNAGKK